MNFAGFPGSPIRFRIPWAITRGGSSPALSHLPFVEDDSHGQALLVVARETRGADQVIAAGARRPPEKLVHGYERGPTRHSTGGPGVSPRGVDGRRERRASQASRES